MFNVPTNATALQQYKIQALRVGTGVGVAVSNTTTHLSLHELVGQSRIVNEQTGRQRNKERDRQTAAMEKSNFLFYQTFYE